MSHKIGYHVVNYIIGRDDVFIYGIRFTYLTTALICLLGAILTVFSLFRRVPDTENQN